MFKIDGPDWIDWSSEMLKEDRLYNPLYLDPRIRSSEARLELERELELKLEFEMEMELRLNLWLWG